MENEIYQYEDYRLYLSERFRQLQAVDPGFSQRRLARVAGFANPGFFNDVIKGRRRLSPLAVEKMGAGLSLEPNEVEFLRHLVDFNESDNPAEKQEAQRKLGLRRNHKNFRRLTPDHAGYYQDMHYPLVRAAIAVCDFRGDYDKLAGFLRPSLPTAVVKRCVRDLCAWGLVTQDQEGHYLLTHPYLEPPEEYPEIIRRLNREWILQAAAALDLLPPRERHMSSALLQVSEQTYNGIVEHLETSRERLLEMVKQDSNPADRVVQVNMQVFPRTVTCKRR
jgi:uncharacterized protein (TIGR02147 family)